MDGRECLCPPFACRRRFGFSRPGARAQRAQCVGSTLAKDGEIPFADYESAVLQMVDCAERQGVGLNEPMRLTPRKTHDLTSSQLAKFDLGFKVRPPRWQVPRPILCTLRPAYRGRLRGTRPRRRRAEGLPGQGDLPSDKATLRVSTSKSRKAKCVCHLSRAHKESFVHPPIGQRRLSQ